jgi:hypothetical protein
MPGPIWRRRHRGISFQASDTALTQDDVDTIMAESFFLPYLLVLFLLPLLVRWRRGLVAAAIVTVVELGLVVLIFYLMAAYHLLPDMYAGEPGPEPEHPFAKIRRSQAAGYAQLFIFGVGPALAALAGGGLAVVWSVVLAVWRSIAKRTRQ